MVLVFRSYSSNTRAPFPLVPRFEDPNTKHTQEDAKQCVKIWPFRRLLMAHTALEYMAFLESFESAKITFFSAAPPTGLLCFT